MSLYDVTTPKVSLVKTKDAENYEVIQAVPRKTHPLTWARIVKTVDDAIDDATMSWDQKLVWTKSAALFGYESVGPKRHIDHLWEHVQNAVGQDKECLMAVGGLLRWRISGRSEQWIVYRQDSGKTDPLTGKKITISEYWIDEKFNPKNTRF